MKIALISQVLVLILSSALSWQFDANNVGVAYGPYTDNLPGRLYNQYSKDDIKNQLSVVGNYFHSISTYSMGTANYNANNAWDNCDSTCLIPRAAAELNQQRGYKLSVNIGIFQEEDIPRATQNAFSAAADANGIFSGSVWGITFTNEYIQDASKGQTVLNWLTANKGNANSRGLKVGTRTEQCGQLAGGGPLKDILSQIVRNSDYIYCNVYPDNAATSKGPQGAVQAVGDYFFYLRSEILKISPNIQVYIGETGWPSDGISFNGSNNNNQNLRDYWYYMNAWASQNGVHVQMFEAIDEPWKSQNNNGWTGEGHYGYWTNTLQMKY